MAVRIYIVESPGSPNCPPDLKGGCVNTGLVDPSRFASGCGDAIQFADLNAFYAYTNQKGEQTRLVSTAAEAAAVCSQSTIRLMAPTVAPVVPGTPPPAIVGGARTSDYDPGDPLVTGDLRDTSVVTGQQAVIARQPSLQPNITTHAASVLTYRLIMETAPGRVDTGATYPACSRTNPEGCVPMQFASIDAAIQYAQTHNEIPVQVGSAEEAWSIIEGKVPASSAKVLSGFGMDSSTLLMIGAASLLLFGGKKWGKSRG